MLECEDHDGNSDSSTSGGKREEQVRMGNLERGLSGTQNSAGWADNATALFPSGVERVKVRIGYSNFYSPQSKTTCPTELPCTCFAQ